MATFSILENIRINDPEVAEALVFAIEESESAAPRKRRAQTEYRMANEDDIVRFHESNQQRRVTNA